MDRDIFDQLRDIVYRSSGISLGEGKEALVGARIAKRMRALNLPSHEEYLKYLLADQTGEELVRMLDVISTNVTSFFRESAHFDLLGRLASEWFAAGQRRFRFWSAASSTGEEPYTMAITLQEALRDSGLDWKILATDISTNVLQKCAAGVYSKDKVKDMPAPLLDRYFHAQKNPEGAAYRVKETLKQRVVFKRLNLSTPPFPMKGPLDAVFCRNVMIYFDNEVRRNLLNDIYRLLKPGGYLMVGHAESLTGMMSEFKAVQPSVYRKG